MKDIFLALSSIIVALSFMPYLFAVARGTVKPRLVTWLTWSGIGVISTVAGLSEHAHASVALTGITTLIDIVVVFLAFKHGDRSFSRLDIVCQILAAIGIAAWILSRDPAWAIVFNIAADLIGTVPTYHHAWVKPSEEAWPSFIIFGLGCILSFGAITTVNFVNLALPIYFTFNTFSIGLEIMYRQAKIRAV